MRRIIISIFFSTVFGILLQGCFKKAKKEDAVSDREQMIKTDEAFSNMSREYGMKKAFIEFMDDDGILLRPNHMPIIGADAIDFLSQANDTSYTLTWKPSAAQISSSGDLGFTYGIYLLRLRDTTLSGTYVSIWKKQPDGKWKFILDTGNEGVHADISQ
jgi:ketosteroid isomerase-like protein